MKCVAVVTFCDHFNPLTPTDDIQVQL